MRGSARALRLVDDGSPPAVGRWFCGHCAAEPDAPPAPSARVCGACGLGMLLEADVAVAPRPSDPFVVVDSSLAVCAMSRDAEELLSVLEPEVVHRHVTELLAPARADGPAGDLVLALTTLGAGRRGERHVVVRPANTYGVRLWGRVGSCGPPRAALVVLAETPFD